MPQARNNTELTRMLKDPLRVAVDYVVQKIWNENREQIEQIIYRANTPQNYQRTEEFKNAWNTLSTSKTGPSGATVEGNFFYAPNEMQVANPPSEENNYMGQHYGTGKDFGDSRAYLADIIYQGLAGPAYGDGYWRRKRDAFGALLKYIGKARMKKWFEEGMSVAGLDYKRHGKALEVEYG